MKQSRKAGSGTRALRAAATGLAALALGAALGAAAAAKDIAYSIRGDRDIVTN